MEIEIEVGQVWKHKTGKDIFWRVKSRTAKMVTVARCDERGGTVSMWDHDVRISTLVQNNDLVPVGINDKERLK